MGNNRAGYAIAYTAVRLWKMQDNDARGYELAGTRRLSARTILDTVCEPYRGLDVDFDLNSPLAEEWEDLQRRAFAPGWTPPDKWWDDPETENEWWDRVNTPFSKQYGFC